VGEPPVRWGSPEVKKMPEPLKTFRAGQVSCAIWENEAKINGQKVTMLKATVERRYKDKNDQWKSSNSFSRNEIPLVVYCLGRAFGAIIEEQASNSTGQEVSE